MNTKTISMCQEKGSLSHNNREFSAKNIDPSRTADNIVFIQQDLGDAYHQLFDGAVERYNARQKRKDRMIDDYFQHLFNCEPSKSVIIGANKQKSFYEDLVQIGTKDDTSVGTPDAEVAKECLYEYMEGFQKRNPNLYVFNAVMHLDEATPHLHIDFVPVAHKEQRGMPLKNSMSGALREQGFSSANRMENEWTAWSESERSVMEQILLKHGLRREDKNVHRPHLSVEDYKRAAQEAERISETKSSQHDLRTHETAYSPYLSCNRTFAARQDYGQAHSAVYQRPYQQHKRTHGQTSCEKDRHSSSELHFRCIQLCGQDGYAHLQSLPKGHSTQGRGKGKGYLHD